KSNYQDFQRYAPVDLAIGADAEATLPPLIEAVQREMTDDRKRMFADRGATLANRKHGRLTVCIQNDGDLMFAPGVLWTAAHHRIPLLIVMHNNRAYHQETMHIQRMACDGNRDVSKAHMGT